MSVTCRLAQLRSFSPTSRYYLVIEPPTSRRVMDERKRLEQAITRLESQRDVLGDEAVDESVEALRTKLAALEPAEEQRKQVTVLFADLVGFTAMSEGLDPEELREIQQAYITTMTKPIAEYGGSVEKYIGDAVLAVFGVPRSHEDDPERAIRAGLGMLTALDELNEQLEKDRGLKLSLRIGINTGLVVSQVDWENDFVVTGDTVNLASRLESAAEPGTVLVSGETHRLAVHAFEMKSLGSISVKGKSDPVQIYQVLEVKPFVFKQRGIRGLESPLVGREDEYVTLQKAFEHLQSGEGGIVTVVGEAGIGKSRLVAEIRKSVSRDDLNWVEGRCLSYGRSLAYLLWIEVLRELMGVSVEAGAEDLRGVLEEWVESICAQEYEEVYPFLGRMLSLSLDEEVEAGLEALDGAQLREKTFYAVKQVIAHTAIREPVVIVCEDLHWADPSSLALLQFLLPLIDRVPVLLVCIFRVRKEHGSWEVREVAASEFTGRHLDLALEPIKAAESEQLVGNLLGLGELPPELLERILGKAEGNPFYVEEVIRSLIDSGAIRQDKDSMAWQVTGDLEEITIPDTLHGVITARIDRLERDTKRVLQLASIIGRIFLYRILKAIAVEERQLEGKLFSLQEEEMIRERARLPELEYIFKHALTQEAAYNGILKKQRRLIHRQVGEALESLFPERQDEMLGLLAFHWERSGVVEKALDYLQRAGNQARLLYAHGEAIGYYQRALVILKDNGDYETTARTLMKLGMSYHTVFEFQRSRQAYDEAFAFQQRARITSPADLESAPHSYRIDEAAPPTLDPTKARDAISYQYIWNMFSGLVELGDVDEIVPDVAHSWEISADGCRYRFNLRDDVTWSDGKPVTAMDFEYAWKYILDPANDVHEAKASELYDIIGARAYHLGEISDPDLVGVRAIDALTLEVELEQPVSYFLHQLTLLQPVPQHVVETHGQAWTEPDKLVTNGPFQLESYLPGESITLTRNPAYHGRFPGNLEVVEVKLNLPDPEALARYESNGADMVMARYSARLRYFEEYVTIDNPSTVFVGFDSSRPPLDDLSVRRAFVLAVDRDKLAVEVFEGYVHPASGGFVPPTMPGHSPGIALPYDPEQARQLLAQAGYPDGRDFPDIQLEVATGLVTVTKAVDNVAEYLVAQWRHHLNVEVGIVLTEWKEFIEKKHSGNLFKQSWIAHYRDPDSFLRVGIRTVLSHWHHERYERLLDRARRSTDQVERIRLYQAADKILVEEEVAIMPLTYGRWRMLLKPWVKIPGGWLGYYFWKDIIIEPH